MTRTRFAAHIVSLLLPLLAVGVLGCASATKQVDAILGQAPRARLIENVPFINQTAGHCGPATLTMALNWNGKSASVAEIAPLVFTPGMNGTFQTDMISASRRMAMFAVPIEGFTQLLKEIDAGHPVIVFENLALTWLPQWHYAIVFGYDLGKETVTMHSGPEAGKVWNLRKFERSWMLGDYWGLVVLKPGELVESADEHSHVTAAAGLEQAGHAREALQAYGSIVKKWPTSLASLIALANNAYEQKNFSDSVRHLKTAVHAHPVAASAWHNLAFAEAALKKKKEAQLSARRALELSSSETRAQFEKSLRAILND